LLCDEVHVDVLQNVGYGSVLARHPKADWEQVGFARGIASDDGHPIAVETDRVGSCDTVEFEQRKVKVDVGAAAVGRMRDG